MLKSLKAYYLEQLMRPGCGGLFFNPFYFARKGLYDSVRELAPQISGRVLDVGCGSRPYETLFVVNEYVGLELDTPENRKNKNADVFYDGSVLPFEAGHFDAVICNQVLEHVFEPDVFLSELSRVLKPGGRLLLTVPFVWDEHEQPRDFGRYSSFGLAALLRKHYFEVLAQRKTVSDVRAVFQLLNAYLYKITATPNRYLNLLIALLLMAPVNLTGKAIAWVMPRNPDFYLDNVVLAEKGMQA